MTEIGDYMDSHPSSLCNNVAFIHSLQVDYRYTTSLVYLTNFSVKKEF